MKETKFAVKSVIEATAEVAVLIYTGASLIVKGLRNMIRGVLQYV